MLPIADESARRAVRNGRRISPEMDYCFVGFLRPEQMRACVDHERMAEPNAYPSWAGLETRGVRPRHDVHPLLRERHRHPGTVSRGFRRSDGDGII